MQIQDNYKQDEDNYKPDEDEEAKVMIALLWTSPKDSHRDNVDIFLTGIK